MAAQVTIARYGGIVGALQLMSDSRICGLHTQSRRVGPLPWMSSGFCQAIDGSGDDHAN